MGVEADYTKQREAGKEAYARLSDTAKCEADQIAAVNDRQSTGPRSRETSEFSRNNIVLRLGAEGVHDVYAGYKRSGIVKDCGVSL